VPNPEIAPQKGPSGILGGMYGCTRYGGGCVGQDGRDKFHGGIDLKANYGDPIYAMHDGTASLAHQGDGSKGAGYYVVLTSTVGRDTVKTLYFHMQKDNRVSGTVKAGDIIGYQGDSGNLKGAIEDGYAVSHLHIKVKKNGTTVDPEQYMETFFNDTTGVATHSSDCN
jgi:murein DD-endopeptidase MepM/ murein hydrolase activator NlpD